MSGLEVVFWTVVGIGLSSAVALIVAVLVAGADQRRDDVPPGWWDR